MVQVLKLSSCINYYVTIRGNLGFYLTSHFLVPTGIFCCPGNMYVELQPLGVVILLYAQDNKFYMDRIISF